MYGEHSGTYTWIDWCPLCHHHNCLEINPKSTREGEITCSICDADYDGTSGYDKYQHGSRAELTPYNPPEYVLRRDPISHISPHTVFPLNAVVIDCGG